MDKQELTLYNRSQVQTMLHDFKEAAWLDAERFMRFWIGLKAKKFREAYGMEKSRGESAKSR